MSLDKVLSEIQASGFELDNFLPDGKLRRFKRTPSDKNPDCWYVGHTFNSRQGSQEIIAIWKDWSESGDPHTYCTLGKQNGDKTYIREEIEEAIKRADKEQEKERETCRNEASAYLKTLTHEMTPYLKKKGLSGPCGAFSDGDVTVIPVMKGDIVHGYQTIDPEGRKRFKLHTAKKGNYFVIKGTENPTYLVEGFATGATVHMATGSKVVVCFDAGNVKEVKKQFSEAILAGDNDEAGRAAGSGIFPEIEGQDWNDVYLSSGIEVVKKALTQQPKEYVRPLGYKDDDYFYSSSSNRQIIKLSASSHTENNYMAIQPLEYWEGWMAGKNGADWKRITSSLMATARAKGIFNPKHIRGTGAWMDGELIVNCGDHVYPSEPDSKYIYIVSGYVPKPVTVDFDSSVITGIIDNLSWKHPNYGKLLLGWLTIAPFCGALQWRPHMWLTGKAGSGKSTVLEQIVSPILGEYKISVKGNSTEAGIRQALSHDAKPVIFDEFEQFGDRSNERNQAIMDLFRQASFESSGEIIKGSSGGTSVQYSARFCGFVSSIQTGLHHQADIERFAVIELNPPNAHDKDAFRRIQNEFLNLTPEYSQAMFSHTFSRFTELKNKIDEVWDILNKQHTPRFAQQYSGLVAGYWLLTGKGIDEFNFEDIKPDERDSDEASCLDHLLSSVISVEDVKGFKHDRSIHDIVLTAMGENTDNQAEEALFRHGMKVSTDKSYLCIADKNPSLRKVFDKTKWANDGWGKSLARLEGSKKTILSMRGKGVRGVKVFRSRFDGEEDQDGPVL